jgi:hypothetical protein
MRTAARAIFRQCRQASWSASHEVFAAPIAISDFLVGAKDPAATKDGEADHPPKSWLTLWVMKITFNP